MHKMKVSAMRFLGLATALLSAAMARLQGRQVYDNGSDTGYPPPYCLFGANPTTGEKAPIKFAYLLFRGYEVLDVMGPIQALTSLSRLTHIELVLIAETLDPVTTAPLLATMNKFNSTPFYTIQPTHTFETAPKDIEVMAIPGGAGSRSPYLNNTYAFLQETVPNLRYLFTVCTGSFVASKAGLLDGKRATTNKLSWKEVTSNNPRVQWIPHARWVVDGKFWTTSGVSAGIDGLLAFIECFYGAAMATTVTNGMEYERHPDPAWDPFQVIFNATTPLYTPPKK